MTSPYVLYAGALMRIVVARASFLLLGATGKLPPATAGASKKQLPYMTATLEFRLTLLEAPGAAPGEALVR